eukprot:GHVT01025882.1.p3 GENE.GHVT01025882.1~~GHVT01025882.1.p3  ORF type:complete len:139 (-),score=34.38 GHVT01025882.1:1219-1635(-)
MRSESSAIVRAESKWGESPRGDAGATSSSVGEGVRIGVRGRRLQGGRSVGQRSGGCMATGAGRRRKLQGKSFEIEAHKRTCCASAKAFAAVDQRGTNPFGAAPKEKEKRRKELEQALEQEEEEEEEEKEEGLKGAEVA